MGADQMASRADHRRAGLDWVFVPVDDSRARRPIDVVVAAIGAILVLFTALNADQVRWLEESIGEFVALFPPWLDSTLAVIYVLAGLYAVLIIIIAGIRGGPRLGLFRDLLVAGVLVGVVTVVLTQVVDGAWPVLFPEIQDQPDPLYPVLRVAFVTAILMVAAPHFVRPLRRVNWVVVFLVGVAAADLGYGLPNDTVGGFGVGLLVAGLVLIVFRSPRGVPNRVDVQEAVEQLGVDVSGLAVADQQSWGARQFEGTSSGGEPISITSTDETLAMLNSSRGGGVRFGIETRARRSPPAGSIRSSIRR